jgi:hypothetical protein
MRLLNTDIVLEMSSIVANLPSDLPMVLLVMEPSIILKAQRLISLILLVSLLLFQEALFKPRDYY